VAQSPVKAKALADPGLLDSAVEFKQRFFQGAGPDTIQRKPGSLVLVPEDGVLGSVWSDYRAMENMIFGEVPIFDEILVVLQAPQDKTNTRFGKILRNFFKKLLIMGFFAVSILTSTGKAVPVLASRGLFRIEWE